MFCGLNETFIFSDHIQSCQLAFEHVRLIPVNVVGSTTGTHPVNEWGDGEGTSAKLQSGNKVFNGVLGRGTKENRVASP